MNTAKFALRIAGVAPGDLPMRRLAACLEEFARLLGEEASIRFEGVTEGSTKISARAPSIAVPKVRARLAAARDASLDDARRTIDRIDALSTLMLLLTDDLALAPPAPHIGESDDQPVATNQARERLTFLIETLDDQHTNIVVPTPVLTELFDVGTDRS